MPALALELSIRAAATRTGGAGGPSAADALLGAETDGLAFVSSDDSIRIRDTTTPANAYAGTPGAKLTTTRASNGTYWNSGGALQTAGNNVLRRDYDSRIIGGPAYLKEEARTNIVLWNRDLTNAAWVSTSCTAAKNQTGIDGIANSASLLTATGANGTCLQTTTVASTARWQSCFIKRITGSGVISMTQDNGVTWTPVTVTASWAAVEIPGQTLANPVVGFRIATSGDAVAIDMVQNELTSRSSPIETTTAATTRAVDNITILTSLFPWNGTAATAYCKVQRSAPTNSGAVFHGYWGFSGAGTVSVQQFTLYKTTTFSVSAFSASVQSVSRVAGDVHVVGSQTSTAPLKFGVSIADGGTAQAYIQGVAFGVDTLPAADVLDNTLTTLSLGDRKGGDMSINQAWYTDFMVLPRNMSAVELGVLTTP